MTYIIILGGLLLFIMIIALVRAQQFPQKFEPVSKIPQPEVHPEKVAEHLAAAIRYKTVSYDDRSKIDYNAFTDLHKLLKKQYPTVHKHLKRELVNQYSLLYTWEGGDPSLDPLVFMAHQDVVPAEGKTLEHWKQPPFEGLIDRGFVWGRGAMDMKSQLITILEAVENLLEDGYRPQRTIYLVFGHDEEIGGSEGSKAIAELLESRGVRPEAVLDEGGIIINGMLKGIEGPAALIGNTEKGYMTVKLTVKTSPGHSSMPPKQTAIGILSKGLVRLESKPMKSDSRLIVQMMRGLGESLPFAYKLLFANMWLFRSIVGKVMSADPKTSSMIRTSTAITVINSGVKENILPDEATALVNFRISPRDTVEDVLAHVRRVVKDDRIEITKEGVWDASAISSVKSNAYYSLVNSVRQVFGPIPVAPYLVTGGTDARYFSKLSKNVYRFTPIHTSPDDVERVHGYNERISVGNLECMVRFFTHLIQQWDNPQKPV